MDDETLIGGLNKSDKEAFEHLYDKYVKMVYSFLISILKDSQISEDITQWCFMQLWEHRREMSADRNVPAWLYVTAKNAALKELRRQLTASRYVEHIINTKDPFDVLQTPMSDMKVIAGEVATVVQALPEARRRIFLMRTVEGMTVNQIAQTLNISPKTVETQIARAKLSLRKRISELLFIAITMSFGI